MYALKKEWIVIWTDRVLKKYKEIYVSLGTDPLHDYISFDPPKSNAHQTNGYNNLMENREVLENIFANRTMTLDPMTLAK